MSTRFIDLSFLNLVAFRDGLFPLREKSTHGGGQLPVSVFSPVNKGRRSTNCKYLPREERLLKRNVRNLHHSRRKEGNPFEPASNQQVFSRDLSVGTYEPQEDIDIMTIDTPSRHPIEPNETCTELC